MADEPVTPQQLIDDAAKALDETPILDVPTTDTPKTEITEQTPTALPPVEEIPTLPSPPVLPETPQTSLEPTPSLETKPSEPMTDIPPTQPTPEPVMPDALPIPPIPMPEPMIVPAKEKENQKEDKNSDQPPKQQKKKGGKGILIATLLFFIFTLPIAIYYVTQSPQFAEIRSRAAQTACTKGATSCKTFNGKNTGYQCTCFNPNTKGDEQYTCKLNTSACPTGDTGGTGGTGGEVPDNTGSCNPIGRVMYTTGACASKGTYTGSWCPLDCGNLCCNRLDSVCCCMGCFPKGTKCNEAPYNCQEVGGGGCPKSTCYTGYPTTAVPHENCLVCSPDRSKLSTVTFSSEGTARIHFENAAAGTTVSLTKDGSAAAVTKIDDKNFDAVVSAGTYTISVKLGNESANSVGYIKPDSANKCGRYPSAHRDISSFISSVSSYGITSTSGVDAPFQCWADAIQGEDTDQRGQLDANWDFDDFNVIIGYTATATPKPGICDASCSADSNCESGLSCQTVTGIKRCRKAACPDETDCSCPEATATPTPRPTSPPVVYDTPVPTVYKTPTPTTVRLIAAAATATPTATPTDQPTPKIPVAGVGPGVIGAISVAGSILLLLIGLML